MAQQDGEKFVENYLDTVASGSGSSGGSTSQDGPPMPLPTTDGGTVNNGSDGGSAGQSVDYQDLGKAAATYDFQQAHGDGWEYDSEAMVKQIQRLEDIRDNKLHKMRQLADEVVEVTAPAEDKASQEFIQITDRLGRSHKTQLNHYINYLKAYIDTLKKIDKIYQDEDEQAAQELLSKEI